MTVKRNEEPVVSETPKGLTLATDPDQSQEPKEISTETVLEAEASPKTEAVDPKS